MSQEDQNVKAFSVVAGLSNDGFDIIKKLLICPLSLVQGVWFIMWLLSLSSSTVDTCISSRVRQITKGHNMRHHYETVLGAVGQMNLLSQQQIDDNDNGDGDLNNNVTSRGGRRGGGHDGHQIITFENLLGGSDDDDNDDGQQQQQQQQQQPFDLATNWI